MNPGVPGGSILGFYSSNRQSITVNAFYWPLVAIVWLPLFAVLHLSPGLAWRRHPAALTAKRRRTPPDVDDRSPHGS